MTRRDKLLSGLDLKQLRGLAVGRQDVAANMVFHHLGHESIDGAAHRRNELQDVGTPDFLIERPLDRFHLSTDTANSTQQLRFFANGVRHGGRAQI